ncbi:MAG: protoheme IX farnesyltransferase [Phycisphaerae bacterium]|nr:protoheme IX farnesyltransferase [Phycisphaerae bacterium]
MKTISPAISTPTAHAHARGAAFFRALLETTKPGIARLVAFTSLAGFVVAALGRSTIDAGLIVTAIGCAVGTVLAAGGANALNMWFEGGRDRVMHRTASRPIPSGRVGDVAVLLWGSSLTALGVLTLLVSTGPAPALLALASAALYVLVYTPLKTITPWCTVIGAIPGALPTLIGAAAAAPESGLAPILAPFGLAIFALLFVWQMPHFFALAWMYRDDYAKGGMKMLTVVDPTGHRAGRASLVWATLLIPATIAPAFASPVLGAPYAVIAGATSAAFLWMVIAFAKEPTKATGRRVFFGSIAHLPLLLVVMLMESTVRALLGA